ncbi:hypothetical protein SLA2020_442140 [Shorea laevis]
MTNGGVDHSVECTGSIQTMISAFECVHDVSNFKVYLLKRKGISLFPFSLVTKFWSSQGWGVAVLVGVPSRDDSFKTSPVNFLNERTLKVPSWQLQTLH